MHAGQLLRAARRGRGLSQRALAGRAGFHQPALADIERAAHDTRVESLSRLLAASGSKLFALPTLLTDASGWADIIYEELRGERSSESAAFRGLIGLSDDLAKADLPMRVALCVAPPGSCGDERFDAAIAAVVEHHLRRDRLPVPAWVSEATRTLSTPWRATPHARSSEVPPSFRRHGVLLAASELESV